MENSFKTKLFIFARKHVIDLTFNFLTFIVVVLVLVLPSTHVYFTITHVKQVIQAVDHMQSVTEDMGNQGLHKYMNNILNQ